MTKTRTQKSTRSAVDCLGAAFDLVPTGVLVVDPEGHAPVMINRAAAAMLGLSDAWTGWQPLTSSVGLRDGEEVHAMTEHPLVRDAAQGVQVPRFEGRLVLADASEIDVAMTIAPLVIPDGPTHCAIVSLIDISTIRKPEAERELLLHELQHRVKNILATVSALAARVLKGSGTLEEFSDAFLGRLMAMGATHELLSIRNWEGAEMRALVATGLAPHVGRDAARLDVGGPTVVIKSGTAATLGMIFHELATNAVKYGALSGPKGCVHIHWHVDQTRDDRRLVLTWQETGGPRTSAPTSDGFGLVFVQRSVQYELAGAAAFEFEPSGLTCTITFPFRHNVERADMSEAAGGE